VCETLWIGFLEVIICCVWDSLFWVWGSESVLYVGQCVMGFVGVSAFAVGLG